MGWLISLIPGAGLPTYPITCIIQFTIFVIGVNLVTDQNDALPGQGAAKASPQAAVRTWFQSVHGPA